MFFKPRQKNDLLFGLLKFRRAFGFFGAGFWEGEVDFAPVRKRVKIYIEAGRRGVSESQRDFYRELEQRYEELTEAIQNVVVDQPYGYYGYNFFGKKFPEPRWQDYELNSVFIPSSKKTDAEWNLSYRFLPMGEYYIVYFEGWKPTYGEIDD
jgi:hypothetical protein